ncbi:MAG TPA: nuclear transport factor 2 family protein [Chitinophagaceae bacterium]|nr:nuclear transport factor 2 family protein [Chitinophagaceae bacterium]
MLKSCWLFISLLGVALSAKAQLPKTDSLYLALKQQDSIFFDRSFNLCDLDYLDKATHPELVFFHDQGGIQHKAEFMAAVKNNICGNSAQKPIRKPDAQSLEVFPLYSNGRLYGVIQTGIHDFYIRESGKPDRHTSRAKFTHVWLLDNGRWLLREVLSYDHK